MAERIGVTYLPVMAGTYHMALWYENSAGDKKVIEVGPLVNQTQIASYLQYGEVIQESFNPQSLNIGSPFGWMVGGEREWNSQDDTRPSETLRTADDLTATWGALVADATEALALHYEYRPFHQN